MLTTIVRVSFLYLLTCRQTKLYENKTSKFGFAVNYYWFDVSIFES